MQRDADKMFGPCGPSKQDGFEGLELLQEVETGDVGTREMLGLETCEKPRDGICRGGAAIWESQVCAAGPASRELCRQLDRPGVMKTGTKQSPLRQG